MVWALNHPYSFGSSVTQSVFSLFCVFCLLGSYFDFAVHYDPAPYVGESWIPGNSVFHHCAIFGLFKSAVHPLSLLSCLEN
jgi:hypothetical protein